MGTDLAENSGRLGYLVSQYPAVTHTFVHREIRALRKLGFDIRVVSIRRPDRPESALSPEEVEELRQTFHILGASAGETLQAHFRTFLQRPGAYLRSLWNAFRLGGSDLRISLQHVIYFAEAVVAGDYFLRSGVRHVHSHFCSTVALILSDLFPIRFSVTIHGPDDFDEIRAFHMAEKVERAAFIAAISRFASSQIMKASHPRYWNKIECLPLGVDTRALPPLDPARERNRETFRIVSVGRLAPAKAHHILIAALGRLMREGRTNIALTIIGEGPLRADLERTIASEGLGRHVQLAGACNFDRVMEYYRQADVFALASFAEGVPVVLMEAMALGIPCVTTTIAGIPELIRNEVDGLLTAPADAGLFAAALARLMDDSQLRERLAQSGRERVCERYDLSRNVERLGQTFRAYMAG